MTEFRSKQRGALAHRFHHGGTGTRLYRIWKNMKTRCGNPNYFEFHLYGGRGIAVCPEWLADFVAFRDWSLANGYHASLQIDRIDNDGGYSPDNCRWVTAKVNSNNKNRREAA